MEKSETEVIYVTYQFNTSVRRRIYDANRMVYHVPTTHPTRTLTRHDLFYVTKGSFTIGLGDQTIRAGRDSVVILPARICHRGIDDCEADTKTLWILMEEEQGDGVYSYSDAHETDEALLLPPCIDASGFPRILKYFEKILLSHIDGDRDRASAYTSLLLCELHDATLAKEPNILLAEQIRQTINLNLNKPVSNTDIAEKTGKSVKTVENVFKKHFGITIHRYILTERLKKGRTYLEYFPHMTIRDIADEMNFYDEYHFSRQFKKEFGISPMEYKKRFFMTN